MTAREKFNAAARRQKRKARARPAKIAAPALAADELTLRQAAERYHRAESGIYGACKSGHLPSVKRGRNRVIKISDLEAYFILAVKLKSDNAYRTIKIRKARGSHGPSRS